MPNNDCRSIRLECLGHGHEVISDINRVSDECATQSDAFGADNSTGIVAPRNMRPLIWFILSSSILFATLLLALDNTIVANLQPQIIHALGEVSKFPWINVTFSFGAVTSSLLWGKLYDLFDNKYLFLVAVALFEIGAAVSGAARNMNTLIVGRAIGGVGGDGLYLGAMNLLCALTSLSERPMYFSFFGITWGIGTLLGPLVGGFFTESPSGWRWSFYLNLVAGGVILPIYLIILPRHKPVTGISVRARLAQIDFIGFLLFAGAFLSLIMALSLAGSMYHWQSGKTIGLFCCTGILWILFSVQQASAILTSKNHRLFPIRALESFEMHILIIQMACSTGLLFVYLNYVPLYLQFVRSETPVRAGVDLLPMILVAVLTMLLNGSMMGKLGYYMPWYLFGSAITLSGTIGMQFVNITTDHAQLYGYTILVGTGVGLYVQASYAVAQARVTPELKQDVVNIFGTTQQGTIAISLAVANCIFFNTAADRIQVILPTLSRIDVQATISGVSAQIFRDLDPGTKQRVRTAVVQAMRNVWIQCISIAGLSLMLTIFMRREKISLQNKPSRDDQDGDD